MLPYRPTRAFAQPPTITITPDMTSSTTITPSTTDEEFKSITPVPSPSNTILSPVSAKTQADQSGLRFVLVTDRALTQAEIDVFDIMGTLVNFTSGNFPQNMNIEGLVFDYLAVKLSASSRAWIQLSIVNSPFVWVSLSSDIDQTWIHDLPFRANLKKLPEGFDNLAFKAKFNQLLQVSHLHLPKSLLAKNKDTIFSSCLTLLGFASKGSTA